MKTKEELKEINRKLKKIENTLYWYLEVPINKQISLVERSIDKHYQCGKDKKLCLDEIKFELFKMKK